MECNLLITLSDLCITSVAHQVVELCKELKNRNYNIIVASGGGIFEKELEALQIRHYTLPLNSKKLADTIKSKKELKKIITEEKINLAHAYTKASYNILNSLKKTLKFSLATIAYQDFDTKDILKTFLTTCGIDTEKFSPHLDSNSVYNEFGINKNDNTIVYVGKLESDRCTVLKQLIKVITVLNNVVDNLRLLIIGDGNQFESIKTLADETNATLSRNAIILTGARTDVNLLISTAKLFVGCSRAALEAMAEEKPVILAGNKGYLGLFTEDKQDAAINSGFCCVGCEQSSEKILAQEIGEFFGMWDDEVEKIGQFGRNLILSNYSLKLMADDAEKSYRLALGIE